MQTQNNRTFADILIEERLVTAGDLARILGERKDAAEPIGDLLVRQGLLSPKDKARCLGKQLGVPFVDLSQSDLDPTIVRMIPHTMAVRLQAIPIRRRPSALSVAMANPLDITTIDTLQVHTGLEIDPIIAAEDDIRDSITRMYGNRDDLTDLVGEALRSIHPGDAPAPVDADEAEPEVRLTQLKESNEGSPVIRIVNAVIMRAIAGRSSDIHISPERARVRIRYRIDGMLQEVMMLPKDLQHPFVSRLKILASMDIAERRIPQDGRLTLLTPQGEYDFRVSTYPSLFGENVVIRILDKKAGRVGLPQLGMQADILTRVQTLTHRPYGMFLVCGPTGSGKTTTLYACLNALNSAERNIMTIEDPIEYQVSGIVQGSVNAKAGITFATGLRTLVRQDPDVLLVGEIRDAETARVAVEAALTGHFVLSTIHANDSAGAVTRLIDMGVEPFLIASSLTATLAQRLVRQICPACSAPYTPDIDLLIGLDCADLRDEPGFQFMRGTGCETCNKTGYRGRSGAHELMEVTPEIQAKILAQASSQEIKVLALAHTRSLREDAVLKVRQGLTTPEEVARVTVI